MPTFDPLNPQNGQTADADFLRNQFNSLKGLIDAVPPGPAGQNGTDGAPGPQGPAGADGRSVSNVYDDGSGRCVIQMSDGNNYGPFTIATGPSGIQGMQGPQGEKGDAGAAGNNGSDGGQGPQGPQGNNGNDGRYVSNVYDDGSGRAVIQMSDGGTFGPFTVATGPQGNNGNDGAQGPQGNNGSDGGQGPQGPQGNNGSDGAQGPQGPQGNPGEVSNADLTTAMGSTSSNTNAVSQLGLTVSDPPTQSEMQTIANKLDELIAALRR